MAISHHKVVIVGCGPGGPEYVTPAAAKAVAQSQAVVGAQRLLRLFPESLARQTPLPPAVQPAIEAIADHLRAGSVAVLVSGDPGLFSLAKAVIAHFGGNARFGGNNVEIIPAVSSLQAAFARLGLDWGDTRIISSHGRIPAVTARELSRSDKVAIFAGARQATAWVRSMVEELADTHALFVCENLTLPEETVREVGPEELQSAELSSLTLLILVRRSERAAEPHRPDSMGV